MIPVFADPKTDFVFKRIFGAAERKPLLIALLNDLLELDGEHRILDVQHLSLEQHVSVPELKLSIVDVKCTDATGRRFVVDLELPKYAAGDDPQTMIEKWAYFFREAKNLRVVPPALAEGPFRQALDVARTASFTPEEWEAYERAKMAEQDARGALAVAHEEGIVKGHRSGIIEGKSGALLRLLTRAGIALTEVDRARIEACTDAGTLDRWIDNVFGAKTASDVLS